MRLEVKKEYSHYHFNGAEFFEVNYFFRCPYCRTSSICTVRPLHVLEDTEQFQILLRSHRLRECIYSPNNVWQSCLEIDDDILRIASKPSSPPRDDNDYPKSPWETE